MAGRTCEDPELGEQLREAGGVGEQSCVTAAGLQEVDYNK